jgi:two-component system sensor histidine kinase/response regulator
MAQELRDFMSHEQTKSSEPRAAASSVIASANRTHVLVAEDNRLNSLLMQEQLRLLGFSAEFSTTGSDALVRWREGAFAALLTDIQMPGMDGYELARRIREEEGEGARIPIIALTANAFHDRSAHWRTAGIDAYLMKPAELTVLRATLEQWIGKDRGAPSQDAVPPSRDQVEAPVDLRVLRRSVGDDPVVLADFLAAFAVSAAAAVQSLDAAMSASEPDRVASIAHQLKSSARAIGAVELGQLCAGMETAAQGEDAAALLSSWQRFQAEVAVVLQWLSAQVRDVAPVAEDRPCP